MRARAEIELPPDACLLDEHCGPLHRCVGAEGVYGGTITPGSCRLSPARAAVVAGAVLVLGWLASG